MHWKGALFVVTVCALVAVLSAATRFAVSGSFEEPATSDAGPIATADRVAGSVSEPIIIDHTCTDLSQIPDHWIEQARRLAIHYAHTSYGTQIQAYLPSLESLDPLYDYSVFFAGSAPPSSLAACETGALCVYDGNPPGTYIMPDDYWESSGGMNRTRAVADTGLFGFSMWAWSGQVSSYSDAQIQQYLDTMSQLETEYPGMKFILMTGHTDGGSVDLTRHNEMIRQYANDHNMVLYDFADIESYDPDGNYYPSTTEACSWCGDWCAVHPEDCQDLPACPHSHGFNCKLKGRAFWWMMARLAGWPGRPRTEKTASAMWADFGEAVTYRVVIQELAAPLTATVHMTDTLPAALSYVPGTLMAEGGTGVAGASGPSTLTWSGMLSPTSVVSVSYVASVAVATPEKVENAATIDVPGYETFTTSVRIVANSWNAYLPLTLGDYFAYFEGLWEKEENDSYLQANGPLRSGQDYYGYPDDEKDFYSVYMPTAGTISVDLDEHTGDKTQLFLYYGPPVHEGDVGWAHEDPYKIDYAGAAGWYYIYIYVPPGYRSNTTPYTLQVTYP
jgi:uncharacterized repeat protein (TIGR01451 family)